MENTEFDEEQIRRTYPKLYAALLGPKEPLQEQLILASLFVMSFECLKDYVEDSFQTFFSNGFTTNESAETELSFREDFREKKLGYQNLYKDLSLRLLNKVVKGANLFQIAIAWFFELEAINEDEFILLSSCNQIRNDLAHELYRRLVDEETPVLDKDLVYAPMHLYFKLSNWWVVNFEAAVNPEAYQNYSEKDLKSAMSFNVQILLQVLQRFYPDDLK